MRSLFIETTVYILICFVIYFLDPQASYWLAYYHTGIEQFEFWRLITATFCHTNLNHLLMNLVGLVITLSLFINTFKKIRLFPLIIFNSLFIGLALFFLETNLSGYVGFSGVLHGLFSYGSINDIHRKDKWGYLLGGGLMAKVTYEQFFGAEQSTIDLIGSPVLVNAHLYGLIAGVLFYFISAKIK
jgi:rhomboid family GlyGly-CTERM serine protease